MNERNAAVQQMLKAEGLYKGKIDGIIGPVTRRALELHNKAQYQPIPRERPGPPVPLQGSVATGIADPGAMARLQLNPVAQPAPGMPPMPNSMAEIQNPSYGGPNPDTAAGIRGGVNAAAGRELLVDPNRPSYAPQFTGQPSPPPMDNDALQRTLGQILSSAVVRR